MSVVWFDIIVVTKSFRYQIYIQTNIHICRSFCRAYRDNWRELANESTNKGEIPRHMCKQSPNKPNKSS